MIEFVDVVKELGGRRILDGISLKVEKGETMVILGPSGAGKSVTLKHIVRLMVPDEGDVLVDGTSISRAHGKQLAALRGRVGFLFQGAALLNWLTVEDNVGLPLAETTHIPAPEIHERVMETLALVGLENDAHKMPSELSGGMRKRVGLARAIIARPDVVLYDEPTSGLDPVTSRVIDNLIEDLRGELGISSVVVTHDMHSALSIGTRIAMLKNGHIIELATPREFLESDNSYVQEFLHAQFITRKGSWETPDHE